METRLVQVVAKLLRAPQERVGLVMYSIININIWLQIIEDLFVVDGTYPRSLRLWRKISESIRKENAIRVRLAHQSMSQERIEQEGELYGVQAFLRPARLDTRIQSQKYKPLPMMEILDFVHRVNAIHDRLIELLAVMKKRKSLR